MSAPGRTPGGPAWWATGTDEALADEVARNRRSERYMAFAGVAGAALTVLVLLLVAVSR
ncbi:hypothetical protein Cfla_1273 [Cellulomonas flavigena DSM 20109]|uniref:Uncharacterized protein n=1 Tax=Cellulomonas flavigena (strain ATCC 482 / DSM 20109 / BCRC 11376 / JCM 18109 / NBRC 3775 / NCIMB 8073 / NRS 134) TaxID=446466 RepID=D5UBS8_CELFN|nr:hypothetical protein [Cellulomonas flavigena]ADG74173.1 hypothetical protein Cfla_1273 [Cellulomonas flavigena DSM 20109]